MSQPGTERVPPPPSDLRGSDLLDRLVDDTTAEHRWAVDAVRDYFTWFTGRMFDRLGQVGGRDPAPDEFTATDLVAVTMLDVQIPGAAAIRILEDDQGRLAELLAWIPRGPLHRLPQGLNRDGAAWQAWDALAALQGLGPTKVSKLLARKRPHLVPVRDSRVTWRLHLPDSQWQFHADWWSVEDHWKGVQRMAAAVGGIDDISLLRVLDVAVWRYDNALRPKLHPVAGGPVSVSGSSG